MVIHKIKVSKEVFKIIQDDCCQIEINDDGGLYREGDHLLVRRFYPRIKMLSIRAVRFEILSVVRVKRASKKDHSIMFQVNPVTPKTLYNGRKKQC